MRECRNCKETMLDVNSQKSGLIQQYAFNRTNKMNYLKFHHSFQRGTLSRKNN